jgi:hypothetical protein
LAKASWVIENFAFRVGAMPYASFMAIYRKVAVAAPFNCHGLQFMTSKTSENQPPVETRAETERRELAKRMFKFAKENIPQITDDEQLPGVPANWDDAQASLFAHAGISKSIRVLASVAAMENYFRLDKHGYLKADAYMSEIATEIKASTDGHRRGKLESRLRAFIEFNHHVPSAIPILRGDAETYRNNTIFAAKKTIQYCQRIVSDWLEILPAENFRQLANVFVELENASLSAQLRFFGLADLILED